MTRRVVLRDFFQRLQDDYLVNRIDDDGNCYYRAVAVGLRRSSDDYMSVRTALHDHVRRYRQHYDGFGDEGEFARDLQNILVDKAWCPPFAAAATARLYNCNVVVVMPGPDGLRWEMNPDNERRPDVIFLGFVNNNHYHHLIPRNVVAAHARMDEIVERNRRIYNNGPSRPADQVAPAAEVINNVEVVVEQPEVQVDRSQKRKKGRVGRGPAKKKKRVDLLEEDEDQQQQQSSQNGNNDLLQNGGSVSRDSGGFKGTSGGGDGHRQPSKLQVDRSKKGKKIPGGRAAAKKQKVVEGEDEEKENPQNCNLEESTDEGSQTRKNVKSAARSRKKTTDVGGSTVKSKKDGQGGEIVVGFRFPTGNGNGAGGTKKKRSGGKGIKEICREWKCPNCPRVFKLEAQLQRHLKELHGPDREFVCDKCGCAFLTKKNLWGHKSDYHRGLKFTCDFVGCGLVFTRKQQLKKHINSCHLTSYDCPDCEATFLTNHELQLHIKTHRKFVCPLCPDNSFCSLNGLRAHIKQVHEAVELECKICGSKIKGEPALVEHMRGRHPETLEEYQCDQCGKIFYCKQDLAAHKLNVHTVGHFPCVSPDCGAVFTYRIGLWQHKRNVHGDGVYPCYIDDCNAVFASKAYLGSHVDRVHGERRFFCDFCGAGFKQNWILKGHIDHVHSQNRDYKCEVDPDNCSASYKRYYDLQKHERVKHGGVKLHKCRYCGQAFGQSGNRNRHERTIHGADSGVLKKRSHHHCLLCDPPLWLPNSATWAFHRMSKHQDRLHPNDPHHFGEIEAGVRNRIFVTTDNIDVYMSLSNGKCETCEIQFFTKEAERAHLQYYHTSPPLNVVDFSNLASVRTHAETLEERKDAHRKIYELSKEAFNFIDGRRKVYKIKFVRSKSPEIQLKEHASYDPTNHMFVYVGGMSLGPTGRQHFASRHHTHGGRASVCTNALMKLTEKDAVPYRAHLINEYYVCPDKGEGNGKEKVKKMEAMDIFKQFCFAKRYNRPDVFFQSLELGEMKKFTLEEIQEVIGQVNDCGGDLNTLPGFAIIENKKIDIRTEGVKDSDISFSRCPHHLNFRFLSRHSRSGHDIMMGHKEATSLADKMLRMPLDARAIYRLLQQHKEEIDYYVYFIIGSNEILKTYEDALKAKTKGYVGQATGTEMADYHKQEQWIHSGVKKLRQEYEYVYLVYTVRFDNPRDMYRREVAQIMLDKLQHSEFDMDGSFKLVNSLVRVYDLCQLFSAEEWEQFYDFILEDSDVFEPRLPPCMETGLLEIKMEDITSQIPVRRKASSQSDEEPVSEDDEDFE